jgi:hypothetical protein
VIRVPDLLPAHPSHPLDWSAAFPDSFGDLWRELLHRAGVPATNPESLQLDAVTKELCRLLNARAQRCEY